MDLRGQIVARRPNHVSAGDRLTIEQIGQIVADSCTSTIVHIDCQGTAAICRNVVMVGEPSGDHANTEKLLQWSQSRGAQRTYFGRGFDSKTFANSGVWSALPNCWMGSSEQIQYATVEEKEPNTHPSHGNDSKPPASKALASSEWRAMLAQAKSEIQQSHLEKVVCAREKTIPLGSSFDWVRAIVEAWVPGANLFVVRFGEDAVSAGVVDRVVTFISATPELLIAQDAKTVRAEALAGTATFSEIASLAIDTKEISEHNYVVAAITDTLREWCDEVSCTAPTTRDYGSIAHKLTTISGSVLQQQHLLERVSVLHPTPALGGYPRDAALQWIAGNEPIERGWYGGPIGWFDHQGNGEACVAIRSALLDDEQATIYAGCGIVAESDPDKEWRESSDKIAGLEQAIMAANNSDD